VLLCRKSAAKGHVLRDRGAALLGPFSAATRYTAAKATTTATVAIANCFSIIFPNLAGKKPFE
jgi:hypothetical protein